MKKQYIIVYNIYTFSGLTLPPDLYPLTSTPLYIHVRYLYEELWPLPPEKYVLYKHMIINYIWYTSYTFCFFYKKTPIFNKFQFTKSAKLKKPRQVSLVNFENHYPQSKAPTEFTPISSAKFPILLKEDVAYNIYILYILYIHCSWTPSSFFMI